MARTYSPIHNYDSNLRGLYAAGRKRPRGRLGRRRGVAPGAVRRRPGPGARRRRARRVDGADGRHADHGRGALLAVEARDACMVDGVRDPAVDLVVVCQPVHDLDIVPPVRPVASQFERWRRLGYEVGRADAVAPHIRRQGRGERGEGTPLDEPDAGGGPRRRPRGGAGGAGGPLRRGEAEHGLEEDELCVKHHYIGLRLFAR